MEQRALNEALALYQASVRRSPALMMETVNVDSNRGVTSRGNSPYDKFASPETRAKVLESRMQEIAAFAQSRKIPASNLYALAEAAMRTGKIPDMGQFGLAGDDAVATKQFLISNVLNIAGLEWVDYKGDPVVEAAPEQREVEAEAAERRARQEKLAARRASQRTTGGYQMDDSGFDPTRYMAEGSEPMQSSGQKYGGHYAKHTPERSRTQAAAGARRAAHKARRRAGQAAAEQGMADYEAGKAERQEDDVNFDPSRFMAEGAKGKPQHGYTQDQVRRFTGKERGQSDLKRAAKASDERRDIERRQQLDRDRTPKMDDVNFVSSRYMSEEGGPYRTGGAPERASLSPVRMSGGGEVPKNLQNYEKHDLLPKGVMAKLKSQVGDRIYGMPREELFRLARERGLLGTEEGLDGGDVVEASHLGIPTEAGRQQTLPGPTMTPEEAKKKVKSEDTRSETDKILGILPGDPRGEAWPKLGSSMAALLNLESCGVFRGPRGFNPDSFEEPAPLEEMSLSGGMGAFLGAGMVGSGLTGRTCAMPSYDASYELPEDPEKRVKLLKKMLDKHGLKKVQEDETPQIEQRTEPEERVEETYEAAPRSSEVPVVRSEDYDRHPSRFMKRR